MGSSSQRGFLIAVISIAALAGISAGVALALGYSHFSATQIWALIALLFMSPIIALIAFLLSNRRNENQLPIGDAGNQIWKVVPPELQKVNVNREVSRLAAVLKIKKTQLSDLRSAFIVAEDLALRKIQQEADNPILRHVSIGNADFSALVPDDDLITCVQVTFLVSSDVHQSKVTGILKKMSTAKTVVAKFDRGKKLRLLLVLVTQLSRDDEAELRSSLVKMFASTPVDVDIRLLDFEGLQRLYSED